MSYSSTSYHYIIIVLIVINFITCSIRADLPHVNFGFASVAQFDFQSSNLLSNSSSHLIKRKFRATHYDVGLGACGDYNHNHEFVVALNGHQFGPIPGQSEWCGKCIRISHGSAHPIQARIVDKCPGCPYGSLDLSPVAFQHFADLDVGVISVTWYEVPCNDSDSDSNSNSESESGSDSDSDFKVDPVPASDPEPEPWSPHHPTHHHVKPHKQRKPRKSRNRRKRKHKHKHNEEHHEHHEHHHHNDQPINEPHINIEEPPINNNGPNPVIDNHVVDISNDVTPPITNDNNKYDDDNNDTVILGSWLFKEESDDITSAVVINESIPHSDTDSLPIINDNHQVNNINGNDLILTITDQQNIKISHETNNDIIVSDIIEPEAVSDQLNTPITLPETITDQLDTPITPPETITDQLDTPINPPNTNIDDNNTSDNNNNMIPNVPPVNIGSTKPISDMTYVFQTKDSTTEPSVLEVNKDHNGSTKEASVNYFNELFQLIVTQLHEKQQGTIQIQAKP